jgi:tRNA-splicing ligase RtcB
MKTNITGKTLKAIGYKEGKILGLALEIIANNFEGIEPNEVQKLLIKVKNYPESFLDDPVLKPLATAMIEESKPKINDVIELVSEPKSYTVFGASYIEDGAKDQMNIAMQLPVTVAGALMPDAHQGYGLPIGGVLATKMQLFLMVLALILVAEWH